MSSAHVRAFLIDLDPAIPRLVSLRPAVQVKLMFHSPIEQIAKESNFMETAYLLSASFRSCFDQC